MSTEAHDGKSRVWIGTANRLGPNLTTDTFIYSTATPPPLLVSSVGQNMAQSRNAKSSSVQLRNSDEACETRTVKS